mmetsp:Transcript_530/g.598  ORF Transcript_530/g.598 Transcript_530/m.598 type:complete len:222 (+) Transcript_530:159-824(+)
MNFIRARVPHDNSCLFTAVDYLVHNGIFRFKAAEKLRTICIDKIQKNPAKYTSVYLDQNVQDYCDWLNLNTSWGGENEILILAELFDIQISVIQIETLSILTYSPPNVTENVNTKRIYILYTGQHYDAIIDEDNQQYMFESDDYAVYDTLALSCAEDHKLAWEISLKTRSRKRIKCLECQALLKDIEDFKDHCNNTVHSDDFAYDCEDIEVLETVDNTDDD